MKEHPILFSTPMVKAILDGNKTQTRRAKGLGDINMFGLDWAKAPTDPNQYAFHDFTNGVATFIRACGNYGGLNVGVAYQVKCPYGQVGDRLWVRETFCDTCSDGKKKCYKADPPINCQWFVCQNRKWRSPIFMPRWASRITLEITDIRVQRVQEISEADAEAEGVTRPPNYSLTPHYRLWYQYLWDKINGKRGYGWESNCWVWVLTFKRV